VRFLLAAALAVSLSSAALADEVDLSHTTARNGRTDQPPEFVIRGEGGSTFAPYRYAGACLSWMPGPGFEIEGGAGAGFPGLQLGLAARTMFSLGEDSGGKFLLAELSVAGNTKVDRAGQPTANTAITGNSSLWTSLGFGGEIRHDFYSLDLVASIVFTTQDLTPHFAVHGGIGFGL
jgi:hypothetical protein